MYMFEVQAKFTLFLLPECLLQPSLALRLVALIKNEKLVALKLAFTT